MVAPEDNHRQNISVIIVRRPEHQGEAGGVQQADKPGHHAAVAWEKAVGEHAGDDGPGDAGDGVDADNPGRLQRGIGFILLEKEDPPRVDGVAVDVHKGGGEGEGSTAPGCAAPAAGF